jgi:hypothetical protein
MASAFDERYEIRLAKLADVDAIMQFIGEFWRKDHIMSADRELFLYEYANGEDVNFVLAIDKTSSEIEAIFGFLNCSNPNNLSNANKKDIWGSIWKVNDTRPNMPLLGIELARHVVSLTGCREHIGNGANPQITIPLRRLYFREKTAPMKQYYRLNQTISVFKIAVIHNREQACQSAKRAKEGFLIPFHTIEAVRQAFNIEEVEVHPYKDSWYVEKRYFCHPYYEYNVFGVHGGSEKVGALLMTRVVEANESKALRIVDYIGDHKLFAGLSREIDRLMLDQDCEYADFVVHGFDEAAVLAAGFCLRAPDSQNIIPNYFEPFVQENVDIWVHYKTEGTLFFKADGDQDRPNIYRKR